MGRHQLRHRVVGGSDAAHRAMQKAAAPEAIGNLFPARMHAHALPIGNLEGADGGAISGEEGYFAVASVKF